MNTVKLVFDEIAINVVFEKRNIRTILNIIKSIKCDSIIINIGKNINDNLYCIYILFPYFKEIYIRGKYKENIILNCSEFNNIEKIDILGNVVNVVSLPKSLKVLLLTNNLVAYLPDLPESLEILDISFNPIKNLPKIPSNIRLLNVDSTYI